ncbi:MAG: DUF262 domain-containing protein [Proteobacteria bacterium]|nr:DUF262 domain-containing protein [Pseudomonadota bacterium]
MASSNWNSSPHPISDIRDWKDLGRLEINPSYQRGAVWSSSAKVMLIDSIVSDIPMPKILVSKKIVDGSTHRIIIDGQQRTRTILEFLDNEFNLTSPYDGALKGKYFKDFNEEETNKFLSYQIDFNESTGLTDEQIREVYSRLNKYTFALNKQELRRADFPGDFLYLSQDLADNRYLDEFNLFSPSNRRRLGDVEYTSELIATLITGIQDKKKDLDSFYINYSKWEQDEKALISERFNKAAEFINNLFMIRSVKETRFHQKSDFYSLFVASNIFIDLNISLSDDDKKCIFDEIYILDEGISPSSEVEFFKQYAVRCISDANSHSSRMWRTKFLFTLLFQPFTEKPLTNDQKRMFVSVLTDLPYLNDSGMCPIQYPQCMKCEEKEKSENNKLLVGWCGGSIKTLSNSIWVHQDCRTKGEYVIEDLDLYPPYKEKVQSKLFNLSDIELKDD